MGQYFGFVIIMAAAGFGQHFPVFGFGVFEVLVGPILHRLVLALIQGFLLAIRFSWMTHQKSSL